MKLPRMRTAAGRVAAIAGVALLLGWPAWLNRYPLLFADSLEYIGDGHFLMQRLRLGGAEWFVSQRSEFYTAFVHPLHAGPVLWPVVAAQAVLTAWVVWLTVRSLCRRPVAAYLAVMVPLSLLTSVGWYVSFVMPDIFAGLLCLCLYLIVFARDGMGGWERAAVWGVACFATTVHGSHFLLAVFLCGLLSVLWLLGWSALRSCGVGLLLAVSTVVLAACAQMAVHARLYHVASLFGPRPPYLMARVISDGPAKVYLQQHCSRLTWTICKSVDRLPAGQNEFLWPADGIWRSASTEEQEHLRAEEMPLVLATLRTYPKEQLKRSGANFVRQLTTWGPGDFWNFAVFLPDVLDLQTPGLSDRYRRTIQSENALPQFFCAALQVKAIVACLVVIVLLMPRAWRFGESRLYGLMAIVLTGLPFNAFVTGVLSGFDPRYEDRIIWLLMLLAGVMLFSLVGPHHRELAVRA